MRRQFKLVVAGFGAAGVALVVAGFVLASYLDASGATSIPGFELLSRVPRPARLAVEIFIGVPLAFGAALYVILETIELLSFLTSPIRKLFARATGHL